MLIGRKPISELQQLCALSLPAGQDRTPGEIVGLRECGRNPRSYPRKNVSRTVLQQRSFWAMVRYVMAHNPGFARSAFYL